MKTIGKNIILRPCSAPKESPGGIIMPGSVGKEYECRGIVIKKGSDVINDVEIGSEIIFSKGGSFKDNGKTYKVIKEEDILVII